MPVPDVRQHRLHQTISEHVETDRTSTPMRFRRYRSLAEYEHKFIDHANEYVNGKIHTNGLESFWSMLKRTLGGTYISVRISASNRPTCVATLTSSASASTTARQTTTTVSRKSSTR
jgi:hypothetical protein